jgi:hypothetical protein
MQQSSSSTRRELIGHLRWVTGRQVFVEVDYDIIAYTYQRRLMVLSCVGPGQQVKALRAALNTEFESPFEIDGANVYADRSKYFCQAVRLSRDILHCLFVARVPGLLLNDSDETLWAELKAERYHTPLLPSWMSYLRTELAMADKLSACDGTGCKVWLLSATTAQLDQIVVDGVKGGHLKIEACA